MVRSPAGVRRCGECGLGPVVYSREEQAVPYGSGADAACLRARVPVWSCHSCGDAFTDWQAEEAREAAVRRHLRPLDPHGCADNPDDLA